ncbi:MAG: tetratricopeptide repeat protein [Byssovorax sp.]
MPAVPPRPPVAPRPWPAASFLALALLPALSGCASPVHDVHAASTPAPAVSAAPETSTAFERGMTQFGALQFAEALATFRAVAAGGSASPLLFAMIAYSELQLHEDELAARDAEQALALGAQGSDRAWALLTKGELALQTGDGATAASLFAEATAETPRFATGWAALGDAEALLPGRTAAALRAYARALEIDPVYARAIRGRSRALAAAGKVDEALALLEPAMARSPDDAELFHCRGIILFDTGKLEEAERDFRKALALKPDDAVLHVELGNALDEEKRYPEAEAAYRKALDLGKGRFEAHFNLAVSLAKQGKLGQALEEVRAELAVNPRHPGARKLEAMLSRDLHR